jgi:hypothetical protein
MHLLLVLLLALPSVAHGDEAPPLPPEDNPHPPASAEDRAAVAFADAAVKALLTKELPLPAPVAATAYMNKDEACVTDVACIGRDGAFTGELKKIYETAGTVTETKHTHVVPRAAAAKKRMEPPPADMVPLKDDEFAVHLYARFTKIGIWSDVSVVLHKDTAGKLFLRRIITAPMRSSHRLPPGAKC